MVWRNNGPLPHASMLDIRKGLPLENVVVLSLGKPSRTATTTYYEANQASNHQGVLVDWFLVTQIAHYLGNALDDSVGATAVKYLYARRAFLSRLFSQSWHDAIVSGNTERYENGSR